MTITVTLGRPDLTAEDRRIRALRAREVIDGAGWLFDEYVSQRTQDMLGAPTPAERETIFHGIQAAADLKAHLIGILETAQFEATQNERRERNAKPADHD